VPGCVSFQKFKKGEARLQPLLDRGTGEKEEMANNRTRTGESADNDTRAYNDARLMSA